MAAALEHGPELVALGLAQLDPVAYGHRGPSRRRGPETAKGRRVSSPRIRFTDQQGQYLAFLDAYTRGHGRPPAEADLQHHFRLSPPAVHRMVLTLKPDRLIPPHTGLARSIGALVAPDCLPLLPPPH